MNNDGKNDKEKDENQKSEDQNSVHENSHTKITWFGSDSRIWKTGHCNCL